VRLPGVATPGNRSARSRQLWIARSRLRTHGNLGKSAHLAMVIPLKGCFVACVALLLASCFANTRSYPADWPDIATSGSGPTSCPSIQGIYADGGEYIASVSGRPCGYREGQCHSLLFALVAETPKLLGSTYSFAGNSRATVRIDQPSDDIIEISAVGNRYVLAKTSGDFNCDANGLRLKERASLVLLLLVNAISYESRTFIRAQDGSLVMKTEWHNVGNSAIFPFSVRNEGWVRWTLL
jgi:hypothetical protein